MIRAVGVLTGALGMAVLFALANVLGDGSVTAELIAMAVMYLAFRYLTGQAFAARVEAKRGRAPTEAERRLWRLSLALGMLSAALAFILIKHDPSGGGV